MNRQEAAEYLRISLRSITNLVAARKIRPARVGRKLLFKRTELDRFLDLQIALT